MFRKGRLEGDREWFIWRSERGFCHSHVWLTVVMGSTCGKPSSCQCHEQLRAALPGEAVVSAPERRRGRHVPLEQERGLAFSPAALQGAP